MAPTKVFDPEDFAAFLALLPHEVGGKKIRHAVEVRHESFVSPDYIALLRKFSVAPVLVESEKHPPIADVTSDFVYARLQRTAEDVPTGYTPKALATWAKHAQSFADGGTPADLPTITPAAKSKAKRDVFIYMISGAKVRAPAAAMALIEKLGK
jgi:uncharacterized protein YecE (DUF72 family)